MYKRYYFEVHPLSYLFNKFFLTFGKVTFEKDLKEVMERGLQIPEESTFKTEVTAGAGRACSAGGGAWRKAEALAGAQQRTGT